MPVFQGGKSQHEPDSLKPNNWREDFVEVNTFDLGETFCNKACMFMTIRFHIKYSLVINNLAPFGWVYQFIDFALMEYLYQAHINMLFSELLVPTRCRGNSEGMNQ